MSALNRDMATPPAPNATPSALQSGLQRSSGAFNGASSQPPPQAPPAPTHEQTVAALRHFAAIFKQLESALKDPDLGKSDIKSKVIDGMTTLVSTRILSPAQAVTELATFPERPFEQRKWVEQHYLQTVQAQSAVLDHHRMAHAGTGDYALESMMHKSDPDAHQQTMSGMMELHYGGRRG